MKKSTETAPSNPFGCEFALNTLVLVAGISRLQGELGTISDIFDHDLVDVWFPATCELHRFYTEDLVAVTEGDFQTHDIRIHE